MGIQYLDIYISQFSILLPLILGLVKWKFLNAPYKWILFSVIASTLTEVVTELAARFGGNFYVFHLDTIAQGITLIPFYYVSSQSSRQKKVLKISLILLFLMEIFEIYFVTGIYDYNSITRSYLSVLMSVLSFQYLLKLGDNEVLVDIHKHPMFWFCLAILLYFFANFLIFFMGYQLNQGSILDFLFAHRIHLVILILSRVLLAVGFWRVPKTKHLWS